MPGSVTTRAMVPAFAKSPDGSETVMAAALWLTMEAAFPFACTVAAAEKPLPLRKTCCGTLVVETATVEGLMLVITGVVARIARLTGVVTVPPGPGLFTVICPVPYI